MKISIDRFEGQFAVCELNNGTTRNIEKKLLPNGAKEGDVLDVTEDGIILDAEEAERRREIIKNLVDDLFD